MYAHIAATYKNINQTQSVDFRNLFANPSFLAENLLTQKNILDQVRANSKPFTKYLIPRQDIIKELIDWALRPETKQTLGRENQIRNLPFLSFKILCSLSSEFYQKLFMKTHDEMNQLINNECSYLNQIFMVFQGSNNPGETAVGYFAQFIKGLIYKYGVDILIFLENNEIVYDSMISHINYTSIMELIKDLIFIQQKEAEKKKQKLAVKIFQILPKIKAKINLIQALENITRLIQDTLKEFLQILTQQNKIRQQQILKIINVFITKDNLNLLFALIDGHKHDRQMVPIAFDILLSIMKFQKYVKIPKYKHLLSLKNRSIDRSEVWKISQQFALNNLDLIYTNQIYESTLNPCSLKFILIIQHILIINQNFGARIFTNKFIQINMQLTQKYKFNNILHNSQKEIFLIGLKSNKASFICSKENSFIRLLIQYINDTQIHKKVGFISHFYSLVNFIENQKQKNLKLKQTISEYSQWSNMIQISYKYLKQIYQNQLGGHNPKNQLDSLRLPPKKIKNIDQNSPNNSNNKFPLIFQFNSDQDNSPKPPNNKKSQPGILKIPSFSSYQSDNDSPKVQFSVNQKNTIHIATPTNQVASRVLNDRNYCGNFSARQTLVRYEQQEQNFDEQELNLEIQDGSSLRRNRRT